MTFPRYCLPPSPPLYKPHLSLSFPITSHSPSFSTSSSSSTPKKEGKRPTLQQEEPERNQQHKTMGFPVGYSDLLLPKLVLHLLVLLGAVRRCLLWVCRAVGLGDLLEMDEPTVQEHVASRILQHRRPQFKSVPSVLIEEALPVVKFEELDSKTEAVCCAVCLYDIAGREEVRRLTNCCHVFHRGCLDRWMEHDQHTCPLCRAKLIPDDMGSTLVGSGTSGTTSTMDLAGMTEFSDYDYFFPSLPSSPLPSPILFQPHQLLGAGY